MNSWYSLDIDIKAKKSAYTGHRFQSVAFVIGRLFIEDCPSWDHLQLDYFHCRWYDLKRSSSFYHILYGMSHIFKIYGSKTISQFHLCYSKIHTLIRSFDNSQDQSKFDKHFSCWNFFVDIKTFPIQMRFKYSPLVGRVQSRFWFLFELFPIINNNHCSILHALNAMNHWAEFSRTEEQCMKCICSSISMLQPWETHTPPTQQWLAL